MSTEAHRAKMKAKKERRKTLVAGFTPVPNKRISGAIQAQTILVMAEAHEHGLNLTPVEIHQRAVNRVAATLPRPPMVRSYRQKPSKSDSPAYRKAG